MTTSSCVQYFFEDDSLGAGGQRKITLHRSRSYKFFLKEGRIGRMQGHKNMIGDSGRSIPGTS